MEAGTREVVMDGGRDEGGDDGWRQGQGRW